MCNNLTKAGLGAFTPSGQEMDRVYSTAHGQANIVNQVSNGIV